MASHVVSRLPTWRRRDPMVVDPQARILAGQRVLQRIRFRVGGAMMMLALVCFVFYEYLFHVMAVIRSKHSCDWYAEFYLVNAVIALLRCGRLLSLLAPLADDIRLMRCVLGIDALMMIVALCQDGRLRASLWNDGHAFAIPKLVFIGMATRAMCSTEPLLMQKRMQQGLSIWLICRLPLSTGFSIYRSIHCGTVSPGWCNVAGDCIALYFCIQPRLWRKLHGQLNRFFESHSAQLAAAGIAGLVGNCSAKEVFELAKVRFRSIRLDVVTFAEIKDNKPDPGILSKTCCEQLFECDAFVSHSWHDDAKAKWIALQSWRSSFVAQHGREPKIWLDKYCIDQNDVEANLRCLPVFLSGCKRMVVLCGTTYLSRLWCIIELFACVHMGMDLIEFVPVLSEGREEEDQKTIDSAFAIFDAKRCECFLHADKTKMLSIICAAFGNLDGFNQVVQNIFVNIGWLTLKCPSSLATDFSDADESTSPSPSWGSRETAV